ncbi:hypothetical protein SERLA73DRAFT_187708 [Serpula lacrymans var. lacrymans S7.3]|uniref:Nucleotide exchange factor Fes1 domain-containing protein n=2 Tax=Serpula lacrymans var. lacrymans TaxID=341189 RepID=F8QA70_SERL3|nr:uncharacterized protein SERLADRAFT_477469 [Serpula lacrymans var. lacrymans S7.9]EGN94660.1 hypothetical protein SERLA73DRAFT_187708 [Serpula lacrymans var. lacrymans S7.3]EGO20143.1 hypothetical protein SERLADRAFT_477469 [Serpula lacrymans var. lacrymans S7.9]
MESLLRWGIENSTPSTDTDTSQPPVPRRDLDPAIIDHILGKSDAVLMKEALAAALDETQSDEDRATALDNLEMLVENIDNANNLEKLKMWEPLQNLLTIPSSSEPLKTQTLWVIGTALQNNPSAQTSYLSLSPLPTLLSLLPPSSNSSQTRSKALYALSGLLKHNAPAVRALGAADGWSALQTTLEDSDISVRRKTAFMLNTLLVPSPPLPTTSTAGSSLHTPDSQPAASHPVHPNSHASMLSDPNSVSTSEATLEALKGERGVVEGVVSALVLPVPFGRDGEHESDVDLEEKLARLLHTYATLCGGPFTAAQKARLADFLAEQGESGDGERMGLAVGEFDELRRCVG